MLNEEKNMINEEQVIGRGGMAIVWTIDGDCLYDLPVAPEYVSMFTESDEVLDISSTYPSHDGITVRFVKDGQTVEDFQTSEYFGSILLSENILVDLLKYPYGRYVESPNAKFDGEKFIITDRDVTQYLAWHVGNPNAPEGYFDEFN
jgi:hypothetical protein